MELNKALKIVGTVILFIAAAVLITITVYSGLVYGNPIQLYDIEVTSEHEWDYEVDNFIYVKAKNLSGELIDVEELKISLVTENINFTESKLVTRESKGVYYKRFNIKETNISEFTFNITVREQTKIVEKQYFANITYEDNLAKSKANAKRYLINTYDYFKDNLIKYWLHATIMMCVLIVLFLIFAIFKDNKR